MIALQWTDVDLDKQQLCVARSEWRGHLSVPGDGRIRYVPLTKRLVAPLKAGRHLRAPRMLCDAEGQATRAQDDQVMMRRAARRANVRAGIHILRYTLCSHLAVRGAPARAIQELAGPSGLGHDAPLYAFESGAARRRNPSSGHCRGEIVKESRRRRERGAKTLDAIKANGGGAGMRLEARRPFEGTKQGHKNSWREH